MKWYSMILYFLSSRPLGFRIHAVWSLEEAVCSTLIRFYCSNWGCYIVNIFQHLFFQVELVHWEYLSTLILPT
jgi:hypothetical protein